VLKGAARSLRSGGRILFQMGGRGNAAPIFEVVQEMIAAKEWRAFFSGFQFPWGFYGPEEYAPWCAAAGLQARRIELLSRTMIQKGAEGLAGWVRTTWMPYTERVPAERREAFVREVSERYARGHPPDEQGNLAVEMVRLEVDAVLF
jgi:trans-aconitate 2-methyltransferase